MENKAATTGTPLVVGIPEGVEVVRYGQGRTGEYLLDGPQIRGPVGASTYGGKGLVVEPAPGFIFRYDVARDEIAPVKQFPVAKHLVVDFILHDEYQERELRARIQTLPGSGVVRES